MAEDLKKQLRNEYILLVIAIFASGLLLLDTTKSFIGGVYIFLAIASMAILGFRKNITNKTTNLHGISTKHLMINLVVGIFFGIVFMIVTPLVGLSLAVPQLPIALSSSAIIVSGVAPIVEETMFRTVGLWFLIDAIGWNKWISNAIQALLFSLYHAFVYAGELSFTAIDSVMTDFITAAVAGFLLGILYLATKDSFQSKATHSTINSIILAGRELVFGR